MAEGSFRAEVEVEMGEDGSRSGSGWMFGGGKVERGFVFGLLSLHKMRDLRFFD